MGRKPLPLGTWGHIALKGFTSDGQPADNDTAEKWRASCRYRGHDGHTRPMERWGPTDKKAERALLEALGERLGTKNEHETLTSSSTFEALAKAYLANAELHCTGTTYDRYKSRIDNHLVPAFGGLRIRECKAGKFKRLFDELDRNGTSANHQRGIRSTLSGIMQEAVDEELLDENPVRHMGRIKGGRRKKPSAYDAEQLLDFLARVDGDSESLHSDLPDYLRLLFGTGLRFGEALALRWRDLNLTGSPVRATDAWGEIVKLAPGSLWVNGNIVSVKGKGLVRNDGKTFAANRVVILPAYLRTLLLVRRPPGASDGEPVFPSEVLGWRHPSNMQRSIRRMRFRIGYPHFTTHVGRKSVATALDEAGHTAREIADVLGHARPSMTQDVYMARGRTNPATAASLDRLHKIG